MCTPSHPQSPGQPGPCPSRQIQEMLSRAQLWDLGPRNLPKPPPPVSQSAKADARPASARGRGMPTPRFSLRRGTPGCGHLRLSGASAGRPSHHFTQNRRWDAGQCPLVPGPSDTAIHFKEKIIFICNINKVPSLARDMCVCVYIYVGSQIFLHKVIKQNWPFLAYSQFTQI